MLSLFLSPAPNSTGGKLNVVVGASASGIDIAREIAEVHIHTHTHTHSHILTHTHTLSLTHTHIATYSHTLSLSLTHT